MVAGNLSKKTKVKFKDGHEGKKKCSGNLEYILTLRNA